MRPTSELVAYLNDYFAPEVWRAAKDLIRNNIVSDTHRFILLEGEMGEGITESRLSFDTPPGFTASAGGLVTLAIPARGVHTLETEIIMPSGIPNGDLAVAFSLQASLNAEPNNPVPTVNVELDLVTGLLGILASLVVPLAVLEVILTELFEDLAKEQLTSKVADRLGGITSYRFNRAMPLLWDSPAGDEIVLFDTRKAALASRDPRATGYIDIVLVADGYTIDTLDNAHAIAKAVEQTFHGAFADPGAFDAPGPTVPLANAYELVKSGFRFWLVPLVATDPVDARERISVPSYLPNGEIVLNFANLARLAEIGLFTRQFFGRDTLLVIISQVSETDRSVAHTQANLRIQANTPGGHGFHWNPNANIRDNAQGPFVQIATNLAPTSHDLRTIAEVTQHELAHSPLGRNLADEYMKNEVPPKEYFGPEPEATNVSTSRLHAQLKWGFWINQLSAPYSMVQGAYEHDTGAFRFQIDCKMNDESWIDFCPVCQEQMLFGLVGHGHFNAPTSATSGMVQLNVTYREPFVAEHKFPLSGGAGASAPIFHDGQFNATLPTRVELSVFAASVPTPWEVVWVINSPGSYLDNRTYTGSSGPAGPPLTVELAPGARVSVSVTHRPNRTVTGPFFPVTVATGALTFDIIVQPALADLQPPTALTQSVPVGGVLTPAVDRATGALTYPALTFGAISGAIGRFDLLRIRTEFSVYTAGANGAQVDSFRLPPGPQRSRVSWVVSRRANGRPSRLPVGQYRWRARSFWQRLEGGWVEAATDARPVSFEVGAPAFDTVPGPPVTPFDLRVIPSLFQASRPAMLQATSYHPNNRAFQFEFEIKERTVAFADTGVTTALRQWDSRNTETIALTDSVPIPLISLVQITDYHWQVRAIGDDTLASEWVDGPDFVFIPIPEKPAQPDRWRDTLRQIDPELLLAKIKGSSVPGRPPRGPLILLQPTSEPLDETNILENLEGRRRTKSTQSDTAKALGDRVLESTDG